MGRGRGRGKGSGARGTVVSVVSKVPEDWLVTPRTSTTLQILWAP